MIIFVAIVGTHDPQTSWWWPKLFWAKPRWRIREPVMSWWCRSSFAGRTSIQEFQLTPENIWIVQFSSVTQSCPTLCNPVNRGTPGLPVHHQVPESTQTHVHWVGDAIQPSHPLSSPFPPTFNFCQHQGLFKWVSSSHQVAKVLVF